MKVAKCSFLERTLVSGFIAAVCLQTSAASHAEPVTAEEAHAIAIDAYIYFYSLLSMDVTRKQFTNIESGKELGKGPMNTVANIPEYPPADYKGVVRANFDTLYSSIWLDLTEEPVVVSVPDTDGRYYLFPMLDMWTDVFASPGWRTTGTEAANYLVTPPGWTGAVPEGMEQIKAPTPYVWIIGRTKTDGPADYDAVHKIQAGYKVSPLSRFGKPAEPVTVKIDPTVDMTTPPKIQVDTMSADKYFTYAAELLKTIPPHITDEPIFARMKKIGIEPGKSFDFSKLDAAVQEGAGQRAGGSTGADEMESFHTRPRGGLLVSEHRHNGCVWQLLSQARHCRSTRARCQPARRCDLSAEPRRRGWQAARWGDEPVHHSF